MSKAFEILSDALEEALDDAKTDSPKLKNQTLTLTVEEDSERLERESERAWERKRIA